MRGLHKFISDFIYWRRRGWSARAAWRLAQATL